MNREIPVRTAAFANGVRTPRAMDGGGRLPDHGRVPFERGAAVAPAGHIDQENAGRKS